MRRYIIEQDLLEAIVALPENMFYNTGIGTFLWIVSNKKEARRKGKVQLIDAAGFKVPLRKNLGDKNCEIDEAGREKILELYQDFDKADSEYSKVFDNAEFGYWAVKIQRPLRLKVVIDDNKLAELKQAMPKDTEFSELMAELKDGLTEKLALDFNAFSELFEKKAKKQKLKLVKKHRAAVRKYFTVVDEKAAGVKNAQGGYEADKDLEDKEKIPLLYEGGRDAFFAKEIKPYFPDAWIDESSVVVGYELSFTKYFYKSVELREMAEIIADIEAIEKETDGLLAAIIGGGE